MNQFCKEYISKIKHLFPIIGKEEKKYLKKLQQNLEDCYANNEPESIEILYQEFGAPIDVVHTYFINADVDYIVRRIRRTKIFCFFLIGIAIAILIIVASYNINLYYTYKVFESIRIFFN